MQEKNHVEAKCRATTSTVHTTEEIFFVGLVGDSASKAVITVTVGSSKPSSQVQFQMDTGSECNVLPLKTYCRATGDRKMKVQRCTHKYIRTYTGERYQIIGSVSLAVWRRGKSTKLTFNITTDDVMPLLSLKTCTEMGLVTINNSDTSVSTLNDNPRASVSSGYVENPQPAPRSSLRKQCEQL